MKLILMQETFMAPRKHSKQTITSPPCKMFNLIEMSTMAQNKVKEAKATSSSSMTTKTTTKVMVDSKIISSKIIQTVDIINRTIIKDTTRTNIRAMTKTITRTRDIIRDMTKTKAIMIKIKDINKTKVTIKTTIKVIIRITIKGMIKITIKGMIRTTTRAMTKDMTTKVIIKNRAKTMLTSRCQIMKGFRHVRSSSKKKSLTIAVLWV